MACLLPSPPRVSFARSTVYPPRGVKYGVESFHIVGQEFTKSGLRIAYKAIIGIQPLVPEPKTVVELSLEVAEWYVVGGKANPSGGKIYMIQNSSNDESHLLMETSGRGAT
ncbi:hypothetical protein Tco_1379556 [Tanacetum coccineum]